jgi:hypothetical protein
MKQRLSPRKEQIYRYTTKSIELLSANMGYRAILWNKM